MSYRVTIQFWQADEWRFAEGEVGQDDEGAYLRIEAAPDLADRLRFDQRLRAHEIDVFRPDGPETAVIILTGGEPAIEPLLAGWNVTLEGGPAIRTVRH